MKKMLFGLVVCLLIALQYFVSMRASNQRNWSIDQALLPEVAILGDSLSVKHVRNFHYKTKTDYTPNYYDRSYPLSRLNSVDYLVSYFAKWDGPAHTFLRFNFKGGKPLIVSVEIRKEQGEKFSAFRGLFNAYEIMYVLGDEND